MSEADAEQEAIETLRRAVTTGLMAAMQATDRITRQREQQMRQAEAESSQRHHELRARLDAERSMARAVVADTRRAEFWDYATPSAAVRAYGAAAVWADRDPVMETDRRRLASEISARYGVNVDTVDEEAREAAQHTAVRDHAYQQQSDLTRADLAADQHARNRALVERAWEASPEQVAIAPLDPPPMPGPAAETLDADGRGEMSTEARRAQDLACLGWSTSPSEVAAAPIKSTPAGFPHGLASRPTHSRVRQRRP